MESYFDKQAKHLYNKAEEIINTYAMLKANKKGENFDIDIPQDFKNEFFKLVDKVNLSLMEDKDNFYGYFLFQTLRDIRFDISSPTAVNFKGAKYVIYFNPIIFLSLDMKQMESTIKHEILHILSLHLLRGKELKNKYSTLAINIAMDVVVNQYLNYLPPYATTLQWLNSNYNLKLEPYESFEYYVEKIQTELDLQEVDENGEEVDNHENENIEMVVGQPNEEFVAGPIGNMGPGFDDPMNQYVWRMGEYNGKLFIGTFDASTLLNGFTQLTNGELINMPKDEFIRKLNLVKELIELLISKDVNLVTEEKQIELYDANTNSIDELVGALDLLENNLDETAVNNTEARNTNESIMK